MRNGLLYDCRDFRETPSRRNSPMSKRDLAITRQRKKNAKTRRSESVLSRFREFRSRQPASSFGRESEHLGLIRSAFLLAKDYVSRLEKIGELSDESRILDGASQERDSIYEKAREKVSLSLSLSLSVSVSLREKFQI